MIKTKVNASKKYEILIKRGILDSCGKYIKKAVKGDKALIIADTNTKIYLGKVISSLEKSGFSHIEYIFEAGEKNKSLDNYSKILELAAENKLTRTDFIIALGGGVCGDLSGFAAASYMRGIDFIQIPTTLLAAVDSSVGGKTAVNLKNGKNLAGAFHQPSLVLCDPDTFKTLEDEYFLDGIAEAIKYGILNDKELFDLFFESINNNIEHIISKCTKIKSYYVKKDEFDTAKRQFLNLGHTFGHAIETLSGLSISHGHAVSIGMVIAAKAAYKMGICKEETLILIKSVLEKNNLPTSSPYSAEEIFDAALTDKKRTGSYLTLVLPEKIGKCLLKKVTIDEFKEIVQKGVSQ